MTKYVATAALLLATLWTGPASAARLELKDGSVVQGRVVALKNDVYTVSSQSLGTIAIPASDVRSIAYDDRQSAGQGQPAVPAQGPTATQADIRQIQLGLAGNSTTMSMISALQNDPQLQEILADPEIMAAVSRGDLATLMASEKFMALMNHPQIQAISRQATGGQ